MNSSHPFTSIESFFCLLPCPTFSHTLLFPFSSPSSPLPPHSFVSLLLFVLALPLPLRPSPPHLFHKKRCIRSQQSQRNPISPQHIPSTVSPRYQILSHNKHFPQNTHNQLQIPRPWQ